MEDLLHASQSPLMTLSIHNTSSMSTSSVAAMNTTCNSTMSYDERRQMLADMLGNSYSPHDNVTSVVTWLLEEFACLLCYRTVGDWDRCLVTYSRSDIITLLHVALDLRTVADVRVYLETDREDSVDYPSSTDHEVTSTSTVKLYMLPVILIYGILGNALSFAVLTRRSLRRISTYNYLAVLSVADSLVLLTGLLPRWLAMAGGGDDVRDVSLPVCRMFYALSFTVSDYAVWLLVAVTVDRYVAVVHSLSASTFCTRGRAIKVIGSLFCLMAAINSHFFFSDMQLSQQPHSDGRKCSISQETIIGRSWPYVDAALYSFLPFIAISLLNLLIICHLSSAKRRRLFMSATVRLSHVSRASERNHSRTSQLTVTNGVHAATPGGGAGGGGGGGQESGSRLTAMLLTVTFAFLVTTLPMNFTSISSAFLNDDVIYTPIYAIAELLMFSNHAMNFYLYCATGKRFRQQLHQMACCRVKAARRQQSAVSTNSSQAARLLRQQRSVENKLYDVTLVTDTCQ